MQKKIVFVVMCCFNLCSASIPLVIIGGGPAGLAAGLYGARAKLKETLVITGDLLGGQLTGSGEVENWPGIVRKQGAAIMDDFIAQTESVGVQFLEDSVVKVDFSQSPFTLMTSENGILEADALIIATGSTPKKLGVPGEQEYWGAGVSSCAVCDCFLYGDREVVIVGGGDSAIEEALHLVPYAKKITIFVRSDFMRAVPSMQDKLRKYREKISVIYNSHITQVLGDGSSVTGVRVYDARTGQEYEYPTDGLFLAIGHTPNTELFVDWLDLDANGYVYLPTRSQMTTLPGIFVAGDVADNKFRQAGIAAGSGIQAALEAIEFLRYSQNN